MTHCEGRCVVSRPEVLSSLKFEPRCGADDDHRRPHLRCEGLFSVRVRLSGHESLVPRQFRHAARLS